MQLQSHLEVRCRRMRTDTKKRKKRKKTEDEMWTTMRTEERA
jgi:hypothetical protein